jgi:multiple sugar transport system ATP-binding protein
MNLLGFDGMVDQGSGSVDLGDAQITIPEMIQGARGALSLGVRPEHVKLNYDAPYRGRITAVEYLGTTQIITLDSPNGPIKARIASDTAVQIGQTTGLHFDPRSITLFDGNGQALISKANQKVLSHG